MEIKDLTIFNTEVETLTSQLCHLPPEPAAVLQSLTSVVFDFSHRLERLHLTDALYLFDFFNAASSCSKPHTAWPRLRELCCENALLCNCIPGFPCPSSSASRATFDELITTVTKSLAHLPMIEYLGVGVYCSAVDFQYCFDLKVNTDSDSVLSLVGITISEEDLMIWERAVKRLGSDSLKVNALVTVEILVSVSLREALELLLTSNTREGNLITYISALFRFTAALWWDMRRKR